MPSSEITKLCIFLQEGRTALHYAALNGFAECVQLIAAEGCEIDIQDNVRLLTLHWKYKIVYKGKNLKTNIDEMLKCNNFLF